jgi:hypothetical protein
MLCTAAGLGAGYISYLLAGLVLLMIYGDDGQSGHPGKSSYVHLAGWLLRIFWDCRSFRGFETKFKDIQIE